MMKFWILTLAATLIAPDNVFAWFSLGDEGSDTDVGLFGRQNEAPGVEFVGQGYNLIEGNPDGVPLDSSEVRLASDPGIKGQNWFKFSYEENRMDPSGTYNIPDDIVYIKESSCTEGRSSKMIMGEKSYQEKLKGSVKMKGSMNGGLWNVAFSGGMKKQSQTSKQVKNQKVYLDESKVCSTGQASYRFAQKDGEFELNDDMRRQICRLPDVESDQYFEFLDHYGTHVIYQLTIGYKEVWRRKTTYKSFTENIMKQNAVSAGVEGGYFGAKASIDMNLDNEKIQSAKENLFERDELHWNIGTEENQKPMEMTLVSITYAMDVTGIMWSFECGRKNSLWAECCERMPNLRKLMERAMKLYPGPRWLNVEPPSDPEDYEIVWPEGHWALPRSKDGCPNGVGFQFRSGTIFQDTMTGNRWTSRIHWSKTQLDETSISQRFCAKKKKDASEYELPWPMGNYCLAKIDKCPSGFKEGWIKFQDKSFLNDNFKVGSVPEGEYRKGTTKIEYCCRSDGEASREIFLPTDHSFYLIRYDDVDCQAVEGMDVESEWVEWSRASWIGVWDEEEFYGGDAHPYVDFKSQGIRVGYCYYSARDKGEKLGPPMLHFKVKD